MNILLVDDQPAKLLSHELILAELGENLIKASSAREALEILLRNDVAVILVDVCMPDLDGFELVKMIRAHPRFEQTAVIFISAIHLSELDSLKGYEMGAVDYVPVPVVPAVLRAKVRVFVDLFRKTQELARLNEDLEARVTQRTTELKAAIAHQELLAREVDHRARNAVAVIQAIVQMTLSSSSREDFRQAINGRIKAMARAHTLLSQSRWQGADLMQLVEEELDAYRSAERVSIEGPAFLIKPEVAQNLALALHEMATNAAKYGALSVPSGHLSVSWDIVGDFLTCSWVETNGPPVVRPEKTGFGSKVIRESVKGLEGEIDFSWLDSGLKCVLRIPKKSSEILNSSLKPKIAHFNDQSRQDMTRSLLGRRVLLVEDEPLVAMMMDNLLTEHGAETIGPFASLAAARGASMQNVDAALLDVNVAGELVFPFADEVLNSGVPIIFLTGYQAASFDERFRDIPVLAKPIDVNELVQVLGGAFAASPPFKQASIGKRL